MRPGEWRPRERQTARPESRPEEKDRSKEPAKRIADDRGRNWALPDATRNAFPVTRPITVVCHADRLEIAPNYIDSKAARVVPLSPGSSIPVDKFISEIWEYMKGWGIAGKGLYWRPMLQVHVRPGGEEHFAELRALLDGSGFAIQREQ